MIRLNLAPVLPLVIVYIYIKQGWKRGIGAAFAGLMPVIILHLLYWPEILKLWATWLPARLSPVLDAWRAVTADTPYSGRTASFRRKVLSLFGGLRIHFMSFAALVPAMVYWPKGRTKADRGRRIDSGFLILLFVMLVTLHAWASFGQGYCVFCFRTYLAYFSPIGLLIPLVLVSSWSRDVPEGRALFALMAILILSAVVGYSAFGDITLMLSKLPPAGYMQRLDWFLIERIGLTFSEARRATVTILATLLVALILLTIWIIWRWVRSRFEVKKGAWIRWTLAVFIAMGFLLSPTRVLGGGYRVYDCGGNIPLNYANAGDYLSEFIPEGSLVYWRVYSPTLLLYMPDVRIFPQQLNISAHMDDGDSDELARLGWWNTDLDNRWAQEADFLVIQERGARNLEESLKAKGAIEVGRTPPLEPCRDDTQVVVLQSVR